MVASSDRPDVPDSALHARLDSFIRDVVDNPGAPRPPRGVLLVPEPLVPELPLPVLLRRPLRAVLSSLGADGSPLQVEPDVGLWRSGIERAGAPAVLREDLADDRQPPEDVTTIEAGALPTRAAGDALVAARRRPRPGWQSPPVRRGPGRGCWRRTA